MEREQPLLHIAWAIRRDLPEIVEIEQLCFEFPWSEDDFTRTMRGRNAIALCGHVNDKVAAYVVYELHTTRMHVLNFAVAPCHQRRGYGRQLVDRLKSKLEQNKRKRMICEVRESNIDAQLFFRAQGFRAVSVLRGFYEDTPEDAYVMQYRVPVNSQALVSQEGQS